MTMAEQLENRGVAEGIQQGVQQRDIEIAKAMLRDQKSNDEVIRYTGLTASTINELKTKIKH